MRSSTELRLLSQLWSVSGMSLHVMCCRQEPWTHHYSVRTPLQKDCCSSLASFVSCCPLLLNYIMLLDLAPGILYQIIGTCDGLSALHVAACSRALYTICEGTGVWSYMLRRICLNCCAYANHGKRNGLRHLLASCEHIGGLICRYAIAASRAAGECGVDTEADGFNSSTGLTSYLS